MSLDRAPSALTTRDLIETEASSNRVSMRLALASRGRDLLASWAGARRAVSNPVSPTGVYAGQSNFLAKFQQTGVIYVRSVCPDPHSWLSQVDRAPVLQYPDDRS